MAKKILSIVFWVAAAGVLAYALRLGGWALVIPCAVLTAAALFALDLYLHRHLVAVDQDLARTFLHLMSAVAIAASCMYWLAQLFVRKGF